MGEVILFDKAIADILLSFGFKYTKRIIDDKTAFVFIQTNELMDEIGDKFKPNCFTINRTVNF